jgi:hypothetical protein
LRVADVDFGSSWLVLYAVGIAFVIAGPWQLLVGIQRTVKVERVLSIHQEGVRWEDGAVVAHIGWDMLDDVEITDETLTLVAGTSRIELPSRLEGIEAPTLAKMLLDMRQKALLGLPVRLTRIANLH